jgi:integrase
MEKGIYAYETAQGTRYYVKYRTSNGRSATKRGFTSPRAARRAREDLMVAARGGHVVSSSETFGEYFDRWLAERAPYLEPGTSADYRRHGAIRLAPLRELKLAKLTRQVVKAWLSDLVARERYAAKTVNNALVTLVACLNHAVADAAIASNPAVGVARLPADHVERDYLRLDEIPRYVRACNHAYRPLAEVLIATGMRVSEAIALIWQDVDFENGAIRVLRSSKICGTGSTKGDRYRSVDFGPRIARILLDLRATATEHAADGTELAVFRGPGRWSTTTPASRMSRNTVSCHWHKQALLDAGLRDMPLHSLRHTAAATWLTTGQPLMYVQRQLGHASITTTEAFYGHLETSFLKGAAAQTEEAVWAGSR